MSPDMILGHDLIVKLSLQLNFDEEEPTIVWDDTAMPWSLVATGHNNTLTKCLQ